jgi:NitT/TauT family transport system permease protein
MHITFGLLMYALAATFVRLLIAYVLALACALPLSVWITHSQKAEHLLLPLFDVIQSVPVLAFFPVIIVFFAHYNLFSGAAIFILFISMLWSIVFSLVGGMHSIPEDVKAVGKIFGLKGFAYFDQILLPSVFPYLVTGSLLAFAGGWNIVTVAEVLHTYLPGATASSDIVGIGSILVHAAASADEQTFVIALTSLVIVIGLINLFVWQRLLKYAEKFKFD